MYVIRLVTVVQMPTRRRPADAKSFSDNQERIEAREMML
jgi:hypothetical protein